MNSLSISMSIYLGHAIPTTRGQPIYHGPTPVILRLIDRLSHYRKYRWDSRARSARPAANCNVGWEFAVVWNLRVSGITMRLHEYVAKPRNEKEKEKRQEGEKLRAEVARRNTMEEETEAAHECGREGRAPVLFTGQLAK